MSGNRLIAHLSHTRWSLRRSFPEPTLAAIERAVREDEARHGGQIRFAIEGALDWAELRAGVDARRRALDVFSHLRVWDTERNNGVLIYLLLADRDVEIVADRGVHRHAGDAAWEQICRGMEAQFRAGRFEQGAVEGVHRVGDLLARHFPPTGEPRNELPDRPVVF